jgi:hypothetical protein
MRYFCATAGVYELARQSLDQAWGHVPPTTCIDPAERAPRDAQGNVVLGVPNEFCTFSTAVELLPQLLASGAVVEIDRQTFDAAANAG